MLDVLCCAGGALQVILHDFKCKPVFDLGSGPYSTARWNPFGRFLAVAGFGNLPGRLLGTVLPALLLIY